MTDCWEYFVFDCEVDHDNLEKQLNILGRDRWEIAGVFPEDEVIIFKRPSDGIPQSSTEDRKRERPIRRRKEEV